MPQKDEADEAEAQRVIHELRAGANRLLTRSKQMAEEASQLKQRADDLAQLIKQRARRGKKSPGR